MLGADSRRLAHRGARRQAPLRTRLLAVVALFALAATYLTPLVNVEWAGWRHDHGHLTVDGVVPPHTHPWDAHHDAEAAGDPVVFTASGDSVPGVTALWTVAPILLAFASMVLAGRIDRVVRPASRCVVTAHPPPRALLSTS